MWKQNLESLLEIVPLLVGACFITQGTRTHKKNAQLLNELPEEAQYSFFLSPKIPLSVISRYGLL